MFLINTAMVDLDIGTAGLVALLGYGVVFIGLIALMIVIMIVGKIMVGKTAPKAAPAPAPAPVAAAPAAAPVAPAPAANVPAPGTAGELKLIRVSEKDAALIMAIVAYKLGKPLNELRFKSIKEVK